MKSSEILQSSNLEIEIKSNSFYRVEVSYSKYNVKHEAIFYTDKILNDGKFGSFNQIWNPSYCEHKTIKDAYYMLIIEELPMEYKMQTP